jgi:hypothetical protein
MQEDSGVLVAAGIAKRFSAFLAVDNVDFRRQRPRGGRHRWPMLNPLYQCARAEAISSMSQLITSLYTMSE